MKTQPVHIVISVFYRQSLFHELTTKAIIPFYNKHQKDFNIHRFLVFINCYRGEHVSIYIEFSSKVDTELFTNTALTHFKDYITKNFSNAIPLKYPLNSLFDNYPNNSVHINIDKYAIPNNKNISVVVSRTMLSSLLTTQFDNEDIFLFLLYTHFGLLRSIFKTQQSILKNIEYLKHNIKTDFINNYGDNIVSNQQVIDYTSILDNNYEILLEIFNDVWGNNLMDQDISWLHTWMEDCSNILNQYNLTDKYKVISRQIFQHVGFDYQNLPSLILHIIENLLKKTVTTKPLQT